MPARHLALSLKMSTRHFFNVQSLKKGIMVLVVDVSRYKKSDYWGEDTAEVNPRSFVLALNRVSKGKIKSPVQTATF